MGEKEVKKRRMALAGLAVASCAVVSLFAPSVQNTGETSLELPAVRASQSDFNLSVGDVLPRSAASMASVSSFHFDGNVRVEQEEYQVSLSVDRNGNCRGWYAPEGQEAVGIVRLTDGRVFIQPNNGYWRDEISRADGGWWYEVPSGYERVNNLCSSWTFVEGLAEQGHRAKQEPTQWAGEAEQVKTLIFSYGVLGEVEVELEPPHRVRSIESHAGSLSFNAFNVKVPTSTPASLAR